ncbi:hypothetical protein BSKO_03286 [Bryopsis sp. KO-2023]|nr:hypothetical protein BSKO_03286 [Bryopsis sp. KO-2023]
MDQYRQLVSHRSGDISGFKKRDKLQESKKREAEIRAAFKVQREEEKEKRRNEKLAEGAAFREERAVNGSHSRRAMKEAREKAKREMRRNSGSMCDHGVWKCKICFPHKREK